MSEYNNNPNNDFQNQANPFYAPRPSINMKRPIVTYVLIALNVLVYIAMTVASLIFDVNQDLLLLIFGAKVNPLIDAGQVWRLFTCMFLHGGVAHLLCNCYAIFIYGPIVEKLFGRARLIILYVIAGLAGSVMSYAFSINAAVGASGAIFGLIGCMFYFREKYPHIFKRIFGRGLFAVLGINLLLGFIQPGIDNFGHIGGFLGGFIASWGVGLLGERVMPSRRAVVFLVLVALLTGCVAIGKLLGFS